MANPLTGDVDLQVAGVSYKLRLSSYEIAQAETLLDMGILQISNALNGGRTLRAGHINALMWAALQEHHPQIDLKAAAQIVTALKLKPSIDKITECLAASFGTAEDGDTPSQPGA